MRGYGLARLLCCRAKLFTRLTNAFSKKVENLAHAVSIQFMFYNFARDGADIRWMGPKDYEAVKDRTDYNISPADRWR